MGLYSVHALSEVSEGNDIDRHLVRQMTVLSRGNDQYFRFVTRLSRAMDVKIGGGIARFCARPAVAREYASEAGGDESAIAVADEP